MGVFDEIGVFFGKTIPNVVTKEIPKFVTETVPSAFKRETYAPDLPPLRKIVATLAKRAEAEREAFFTAQGRLRAKLDRYRVLSEDYSRTAADGAVDLRVDTDGAEKIAEELHGAEKTLNDIGQTTRMVATIATLGLLELGLMHADNANERAHLKERKRALEALLGRYRRAMNEIAAAEASLGAGIDRIEAALRDAGLAGSGAAASELRESETADAAKRELAAKLLGDGLSIEGVAVVTGLSPKDIAGLTPDASAPLSAAHTDLTNDETALLGAHEEHRNVV